MPSQQEDPKEVGRCRLCVRDRETQSKRGILSFRDRGSEVKFSSNEGKYWQKLTLCSAREQSPISMDSDSDEEGGLWFDPEDNPEPPPRISEPSEDPFSPGPSHVPVSGPVLAPIARSLGTQGRT